MSDFLDGLIHIIFLLKEGLIMNHDEKAKDFNYHLLSN
jgi:hypothetical protein